MDKKSEVRTRFAPSPTGYLHIGGLRAALFEYAYAKSLGGKFVLRIEDTDRKRFVEGSVEKLISILRTFGLNWDEGPEAGGKYEPYIQSQRIASGLYKKKAEQLVVDGHAYNCFCKVKTKDEIVSEHEAKKVELRDPCRNLKKSEVDKNLSRGITPAIRLKVPDEGKISYYDFVLKKEVSWNLTDVDDAMLLKSDGFPTYHLGVATDDVEMNITHIMRGFEWLPSTPIHLLLFKYFNYEIPKIGHFSLILDPEGGKLSKRKRNVSCEDFLAEGYLPEAILNYVMLMGWAPKDNKEVFNLSDYVDNFQKGNLQVANSVFDIKKLDWFNGYYIRKLPIEVLNSKLQILNDKFNKIEINKQLAITKLVQERITKLSDFNALAGFFWDEKVPDKSLFGVNYKKHLSKALNVLSTIQQFDNLTMNERLLKVVRDNNFKTGDFFMDLRIAICGSKFTPPINDSMVILGLKESIKRINAALKL